MKMIISARVKDTLNVINNANTYSLKLELTAVNVYFDVIDTYCDNTKGIDLLCTIRDNNEISKVTSIISKYNQDCVVLIVEDKVTLLHMVPECEEYIGELVVVDESIAKTYGEYILHNMNYYVIL